MGEFALVIGMLLTIFISIVAYLIPGIISYMRDHKNKAAIILTNIFFGWTGIGWFIALIWAFTEAKTQPTVIQYYQQNLE